MDTMVLNRMDIVAIANEFSVSICLTLIIATILTVLMLTRFSVVNIFRRRKTTYQEMNDKIKMSTASTECLATDDKEEIQPLKFPTEQTTGSPRYPDPVDYCEHIQGEIKRVQQSVTARTIAKQLTEEQLREEREVQRKQLAEIFKLMQEQQDRFGIGTMDDMQEQMKLYSV